MLLPPLMVDLGFLSRKYAHKIPFIVKINHNEFLTYPNKFDQIMFASIKASWKWVQLQLALQFILEAMNQQDKYRK